MLFEHMPMGIAVLGRECRVQRYDPTRDDFSARYAPPSGAISYLLKNVSADELADAVPVAYAGKPTLSPEATAALIHAATRPAAPQYDLTTRELEVLALLLQGLSTPEIAEQLVITRSCGWVRLMRFPNWRRGTAQLRRWNRA